MVAGRCSPNTVVANSKLSLSKMTKYEKFFQLKRNINKSGLSADLGNWAVTIVDTIAYLVEDIEDYGIQLDELFQNIAKLEQKIDDVLNQVW